MIVRRISWIFAAAGMAVASIANAASAPIPSRVAAPVTNANYQNDDGDNDESLAVILGLLLIVLIGVAAVSGGDGEPQSP